MFKIKENSAPCINSIEKATSRNQEILSQLSRVNEMNAKNAARLDLTNTDAYVVYYVIKELEHKHYQTTVNNTANRFTYFFGENSIKLRAQNTN